MDIIATIGQPDSSINYKDRPTVKVIIKKDDTILLLNNGLLPGGGVEGNESDSEAISRELQEELGVTVRDIEEVGTVIQYRNFLSKRYVISGYVAALDSVGGQTNPQNEAEANLTQSWLKLEDALEYVSHSISEAKEKPIDNSKNEGKLYNLMTTYEFLKSLK